MNNTTNTTLSTKDPIDQVFLIVTLDLVLFILYVAVLTVLLVYKKDFSHSYYTLTFALGISDLINLFYISYKTWAPFYGYDDMDVAIGKYISFLQQSVGWYGSFYLNLVIAINRFVAIAFFHSYFKVFTPLITRLTVVSCYILSFAVCMSFCILTTITCPTYIKGVVKGPVTDGSLDGWKMFQFCHIGIICGLIICIYVCTVSVSIKNLKGLNVNQAKYVNEMKLLGQGCLCSVSLFVVGFLMFLGPTVLGKNVTKTFHSLYAGINPMIYLALDAKLRQCLFGCVSFRKGSKLSSSVSPTLYTY